MKTIILGAALLCAMVNTTYANAESRSNSLVVKNSKGNPLLPTHNAASLAAFNAMFPGAMTIRWQIKGELGYQVTFVYNGVKRTAVYSYTGVYLGA
jgi:hypothetical protein